MSCREKTNGGILYIMPDIFIRVCTLIPLIYLWRAVISSGAETGMSMDQMVTYSYVSALLSDMLAVKTAATGWLSVGVLMRFFGHPLSVLGQLISQTVGGWVPGLVLFSLPMAVLSPVFGVRLIPVPLLPLGLSWIMRYQPFACLGCAPLSILVGAAEPSGILVLQAVWNAFLWPFALLVFKKSQEGMVSYGG